MSCKFCHVFDHNKHRGDSLFYIEFPQFSRFSLMLACWEWEPAARPTFTEIRMRLNETFGRSWFWFVCAERFLFACSSFWNAKFAEAEASYTWIHKDDKETGDEDVAALRLEPTVEKSDLSEHEGALSTCNKLTSWTKTTAEWMYWKGLAVPHCWKWSHFWTEKSSLLCKCLPQFGFLCKLEKKLTFLHSQNKHWIPKTCLSNKSKTFVHRNLHKYTC